MNAHIKFRTIAIAILLMASVSTMFGQSGTKDHPKDNVRVTVTNLGNLPQNGTVTVNFYNPDPAVSCQVPPASFSNGYYNDLRVGKYNNEVWSWVYIRVVLGNNQYYADYFSMNQSDVVFQGSDFHSANGPLPAYNLPAFPW